VPFPPAMPPLLSDNTNEIEGLGAWLDQANWGTVPAWFGGLSLLLALTLFFRDRRRDDREQIDKTAVWVTCKWDPTLGFTDRDRVVPADEQITFRVFTKNANETPMQIRYIAFVIATNWWVKETDMSSRMVRGADVSKLFQDGFLLAPGKLRKPPAQPWNIGHHAPSGAHGLALPPNGVECRVDWFLATDNAGRRWEVRPGRGKRARRLRWYSYRRPYYPTDWKSPITYPTIVRFYQVRDHIRAGRARRTES